MWFKYNVLYLHKIIQITMEITEKLKVLIATYGKAETAKMLGIVPLTLKRKITNPDILRYDEIKEIERLYLEAKELPIK